MFLNDFRFIERHHPVCESIDFLLLIFDLTLLSLNQAPHILLIAAAVVLPCHEHIIYLFELSGWQLWWLSSLEKLVDSFLRLFFYELSGFEFWLLLGRWGRSTVDNNTFWWWYYTIQLVFANKILRNLIRTYSLPGLLIEIFRLLWWFVICLRLFNLNHFCRFSFIPCLNDFIIFMFQFVWSSDLQK